MMTEKQDVVAWARAAASTYEYNDVTADELVEVYIPALLAEVERLREIAQDIVDAPEDDWDEVCPFCASDPGSTPIRHEHWCAIARARALLAKDDA